MDQVLTDSFCILRCCNVTPLLQSAPSLLAPYALLPLSKSQKVVYYNADKHRETPLLRVGPSLCKSNDRDARKTRNAGPCSVLYNSSLNKEVRNG
jgi:hypothetical protein